MQTRQDLGIRVSHYFLNFIGSSDEQGVIVSMKKKKMGKVHLFGPIDPVNLTENF